jgi:nicotinamide-nucleotide amidase
LRQALSRADIVICIGGLGPTQDDLTRDAIAGALGVPLQRDPELVAHLTQWFARKGILQPKPSIFRQADVPVGGIPMPNSYGTAPGLWVEHGGKVVVALPGPPSEFEPMVVDELLPMLRRYLGTTEQVIVSRTLRLVGMGEAEAESLLLDLMKGSNPSVAPYAKQAEVQLRVTASAVTSDAANALIQPIVDEIKSRLGIAVYSDNDDDLETRVVMMLVERGESVSTAESCTGGLLAGRLTAVPGSSEVFGTGVVAYSNATKVALVGVQQATLDTVGAVSHDVAAELALGIRKVSGATYGIGITGIAGPGGGSDDKPVGLVYVGLAHPDGLDVIRTVHTGSRQDVRLRSTQQALGMLRSAILRRSGSSL